MKEIYEKTINQIMNQVGINISLILDIQKAKYVPVITTLPTYQGLVCGYCGLKNHKGHIVPIIIGLPTNLSKEKIRKLDDMFDVVKELVKKCNALIDECNAN